jgi:TolB protein
MSRLLRLRRIFCCTLAVLALSDLSSAAVAPSEIEAATWSRRAFGALTPEISPDGEHLAFSYQGAIWRMPRSGGVMRRLTSGPGFDDNPSWSPDGRQLAYVCSTTGEVRVIDAESGRLLQAVPQVLATGKVFFARDGKHLLLGFRSPNPRRVMFGSVEIATGRIEPLAYPTSPVGCYALTADGTSIAYATDLDVEGEQWGAFGPQMDVWVIPAAGGTPTRLMRSPSRLIRLWCAPDRLIFSSDTGGAHYDLWSAASGDPTRARRITFGQADEDSPSVSRDGRWLVYTDNRENSTALVVRDLRSGDETIARPTRLDYGVPTGTLRLQVTEKHTGRPLVARLSVQQEGGKNVAPVGALHRIAGAVEHFYAEGEAKLTVPAGRFVVRAFRGPEYDEPVLTVDVPAGGDVAGRIELDHWIDPTTRSFWSGESHIHANYGYGEWYCTPDVVRQQIEGEGLNVANLVIANSHGDGVFDREFFRGAPDPASGPSTLLYWSEEFRSSLWGHLTFLDLKTLVEPIFTGFPATTNPWDFPTNVDIADHVHLQNGVVIYTHPGPVDGAFLSAYTAKALPVDVALGRVDALDINRFESVTLWYSLLNCGFRLSASAGTDVFLNKLRGGLPGNGRVYAQVDGPFSYTGWAAGVRAGRTFVTNGPMLEFTAAGRRPGDTLKLDAPGEVTIQARADWLHPLERAELIFNGDAIASATLTAGGRTAILDQKVRLPRSGWLSFRAYNPGLSAQAHAGAIYVEVAGQRAGSRRDAQAFLQWIDQLEAKLRQRDRLPTEAIRARVQSQLDAARAVYREIAARSE